MYTVLAGQGEKITPCPGEDSTERVKPIAPSRVKPIAPKPSIEPSRVKTPSSSLSSDQKREKKPRPRNLLFDAIAGCWHPDASPLTRTESSHVAKVAAEVAEVGGTPEQITKAWAAWPKLYPRAGPCTPQVLAKHWNELIKVNGSNGNAIDESKYRKVETPDGPVYYDR